MERTISSKQTFIMKIVFPLVFVPFIVIGILSAILDPARNNNIPTAFVLLFTVMMLAFLYWFCIRLKKVKVNAFENSLVISNYLNEIKIHLSEIYVVTENVWVNMHPVTIHLKNSTKFGSKIVFMPKFRPFAFWSSHPIVGELRELANSNRFK